MSVRIGRGLRVRGERNEHWAGRARCASEYGPAFDRQPVQRQLECCAGCTVRDECLDYALRVEPPGPVGFGGVLPIYGGLTREQRARLKRAHR